MIYNFKLFKGKKSMSTSTAKLLFTCYISLSFFSFNTYAADSLSYSGRLVNVNGSPVPGPVTLRAELAYTNAPATILCTQDIAAVTLTKGVFHIKLDLNCGATPLNQVLAQTPTGESVAIRITDVTNSKAYPFQALHSIPFANLAEQLVQMGATTGQFLKWDGTKWIPAAAGSGNGTVTSVASGTGLTGGPITTTGTLSIAAGGVGTTQLADGGVTDAKIAAMATSKLTGTITSAQILDGAIVNADINAAAAIDYSKLNVPDTTIPYAKLNIADGDIPAAKINGLSTSLSALIEDAITDGVTTKAPSENAVFDALATKMSLTGGTLSVGTIDGVPTPVNPSEVTNKSYVDTAVSAMQAGITAASTLSTGSVTTNLQGGVVLNPYGTAAGNTGEIRFNELVANGANYVALKSPDILAADIVFTLPTTVGTAGQVLSTNGANPAVLSWATPASAPVTSVNTLTGAVVLTTTNIAEGTNLYYTDARTLAAPLTGLSATNSAILATDTVLQAFGKAQGQIAAKEDAITAGTTAQYLRGDKSLSTFASDIWSTVLTGLSTATNAAITATDTILVAFGKLQKQITDLAASAVGGDLSGTLPNPTVAKIQGTAVSAVAPTSGHFLKYNGTNWVGTMVTVGDLKSTALGNLFPGTGCAANQTLYYSVVGDAFSCTDIDTLDGGKITTGTIAAARLPDSASYWAAATGGINYASGNVGVGNTTPTAKLHVSGGSIVAVPGSGSTQCTDFSTGNIQVSSYVASNTVKIGGLVDGGAYTLVLTGYTAAQTITVLGYTDSTCTAAVTYGVDFGGSTSAVTPTVTAVGNTQLITFIYSASRGVVYASAGTNFYR